MKRYAIVEIDEEWSDNDAMLELTWLPCAAHFHAILDAVELQEVAARIAAEVMYDPKTTPVEMLRLVRATPCVDLRQQAATVNSVRASHGLDPLPDRLANGPFLAAHEMLTREKARGAK